MRNIVLKRYGISEYGDNTPFVLEQGLLELKFVFPSKDGQYYLCYENNGKDKTLIPSSGEVSVNVTEGTFSASVKRYISGRLRESYAIEPLEITSVNTETNAFPELSILKKSVAVFAERVKSAEDSVKNCTDTVENAEKARTETEKTLTELVHKVSAAFFSFAYTEYLSDMQMNSKDLSVEEFLAVFGETPKPLPESTR